MSNNNWNGEGLPSVGDMVDVVNTLEFSEVLFVKGIQFCLENPKGGIFTAYLKDLKPIPKETAKQKVIDEMTKLTKDCAFASDAALILYEDGYTKSKVKPLPKDCYALYRDYLDSHELSVYEWLIKNGYCIGRE